MGLMEDVMKRMIMVLVLSMLMASCNGLLDFMDDTEGDAAPPIWHNGKGTPSYSTGDEGDLYFDFNTAAIYVKERTGWEVLGNLEDVTANASTVWHTGEGYPSGDIGKNGDIYLNTATGDIYEKDGPLLWSKIANIQGAAGEPGLQGEAGEQGPQGEQGFQGDPGPQGESGSLQFVGHTLEASEVFLREDAFGTYYLVEFSIPEIVPGTWFEIWFITSDYEKFMPLQPYWDDNDYRWYRQPWKTSGGSISFLSPFDETGSYLMIYFMEATPVTTP